MAKLVSENVVGDPLSDKLREITCYARDKWQVFKDKKSEISA
jgi:hypothetical protein